jgi:NADPH-dependent ferric siderophore reductase
MSPDPIAEVAPALLAHMNDDHPDWVLVVGSGFGDLPAADSAVAVDLDRNGVGIDVVAGGATHRVRVPFPEPASNTTQLQAFAIELAQAARRRVGVAAATSFERQVAELAAIRTFVTTVVGTAQITRNVRQLTFGGGDLSTFTPAAADQYLYVLAPPPGRTELTIDAGFSWEQYETMPPDEQPVGAYYTVRRWRPDVAELDMLFVLHGQDGSDADGPASAWAARAAPGDPVALWGPRTAFDPPGGTEWFLLVADDTGLPAVAAIIESVPATTPIVVVAEVDSEADRQPVPPGDNVTVQWRFRRGVPAGRTTHLVDAVRELDWPSGPGYAWGGAESRCITAVRQHVRGERGMPREAVSMTGYWRHD